MATENEHGMDPRATHHVASPTHPSHPDNKQVATHPTPHPSTTKTAPGTHTVGKAQSEGGGSGGNYARPAPNFHNTKGDRLNPDASNVHVAIPGSPRWVGSNVSPHEGPQDMDPGGREGKLRAGQSGDKAQAQGPLHGQSQSKFNRAFNVLHADALSGEQKT